MVLPPATLFLFSGSPPPPPPATLFVGVNSPTCMTENTMHDFLFFSMRAYTVLGEDDKIHFCVRHLTGVDYRRKRIITAYLGILIHLAMKGVHKYTY